MDIVLTLLVVALPLWLNVKATRLVLRDDLSERWQRIAQLLLVWLVPVIGAIIVQAVHRPAEPPARKYREPPDPGGRFRSCGWRLASHPVAQEIA